MITARIEMTPGNVTRAVEAGRPAALEKAGAIVWAKATAGLAVSAKSSAPGDKPNIRSSNSPLVTQGGAAVDRGTGQVVVGPTPYGNNSAQIIEEGGSQTIEIRGKEETIEYGARPWMGPGLQEAIDSGEIPTAWEGSVKV